MSAVWMTEGLESVLKGALAGNAFGGNSEGAFLLFNAAHNPVNTDTYATYAAIETSLSGYARQNQPWGLGVPTVTGAAGIARIAPFAVTFSFNSYVGSETIFGYGYVRVGDPSVLCAEAFAVPWPVPNAGGPLVVVPAFSLQKL